MHRVLRHPPRVALVVLLHAMATLFLCGCGGGTRRQSPLDPAGVQAERIENLWWLFCWVCVGVYALVFAFLVVPVFRGRNRPPGDAAPDVKPEPAGERRTAAVVSGAVALTAAILFVLLIGDFVTGRRVHALGRSGELPGLTVRVTGHQWWWEIQYTDWAEEFGPRVQSLMVTDANEIHLPVGRTVKFELSSPDVIHSFWVPNLHGKKDLVPGHPIVTFARADRAGTFYGQCAEFCGHQHANMRLTVVAEEPGAFKAWLDNARKPAPPPKTESEKRGQQVFLSGKCVMCHAVQGTPAFGRVGPDLTKVAARQMLAAGAIPNGRGYRGGWVIDPQRIKPGVRMPQHNLNPDDLHALMDYLDTLK